LYRAKCRWSDRHKEVERVLFPGYLFCRFDPQDRLPIITTPYVISIVGAGKTPIPIEEAEVEAISVVALSGLETEPWPFVGAGDRVLLTDGPLSGLEGILVEVKKRCRLVVSVTLLQRSVAVELDGNWIAPIRPRRAEQMMRLAVVA
jgi:transcription antitermination factor NusG